MRRLVKYQLIAFAIGFIITLLMDGWSFHPKALTKDQREALGYYEVKTINL